MTGFRFAWFRAGVLALAGLVLASASARADGVMPLPHAGDAELLDERNAAHDAVLATLREQGMEVRERPAARAGDPAAREACKQVACAPALLATTETQLAVAVAVWKGAANPEAHVTLVDANGNRYSGVAAIESGDAAAAGRKALLAARGLQLLGPGPWLSVEGQPDGAVVLVDGRFVGTLPYRGALASGDHTLLVKSEGYATTEQTVTVPLDPTATLRVDVSLPAAGAVQGAGSAEPAPVSATDFEPAPAVEERASPWNFVLGGVLAAGGLALATIDPIRAAARDGECADASCDRIYQFGGDSVLKIVAGAALIGAGVTVMIWQPLRVETQLSADRAYVSIASQF